MKNSSPTCIINIGIPGAGKTTWSRDFLRKNPNYLRINRDDFRLMLRNEQQTEPKIEDLITDLFYQAIDAALGKKMNLIIDNTNLRKRYIDDIIEYVQHRANVSFMVFPITLETAIERDAARERSVGEEVIKKMYKSYLDLMDSYNYSDQPKKHYIYKEPEMITGLPKAVIFDLDGTLTHTNGKRHYFDWNKCDRDDLDQIVHAAYLRHRVAGDTILIVTGRSEEARESTELWLDFYGITHERLFMRGKEDFRPDYVVKEALFNEHIKGKYNIEVVYEDKQKVVDMWRRLGLKVFQVSNGDH